MSFFGLCSNRFGFGDCGCGCTLVWSYFGQGGGHGESVSALIRISADVASHGVLLGGDRGRYTVHSSCCKDQLLVCSFGVAPVSRSKVGVSNSRCSPESLDELERRG